MIKISKTKHTCCLCVVDNKDYDEKDCLLLEDFCFHAHLCKKHTMDLYKKLHEELLYNWEE